MIVKVLTRTKSAAFTQLAQYLMQERENLAGDSNFHFLHNVSGTTAADIAQKFAANNEKHLKKRNGKTTKVYHNIIAWKAKYKKQITHDFLKACTEKYISMRQNAMLFVRAHYDQQNTIHLHIMQSATEYGSSISNRLSKQQLKDFKREMNLWQLKHYPQIKDLPYLTDKEKGIFSFLPKPKRLQQKDGDVQVEKRGKESIKKVLRNRLLSLGKGKNEAAFLRAIEEQEDLEIYCYRNKANGIVFQGKKYRFRLLGIDTKTIARQADMAAIEHSKTKEKERQMDAPSRSLFTPKKSN